MRFGKLGISHLFFADDAILVKEATEAQTRITKEVMEGSCSYSGHTMSREKSRLFCAQNMHEEAVRGNALSWEWERQRI